MPQNVPFTRAAPASFANIATATSTQVKTGSGTFVGLNVNTAGAGSTVTLYDGTSTAGVKIATISTATAGPFPYASPVAFKTGLFAVTANGTAADITIAYF